MSSMINVSDLKRKTDSVVSARQERERKRLLEIKNGDGAHEALKITNTIADKCNVAAADGKYSVAVMNITHSNTHANHDVSYTQLTHASRIVWNFCQGNKLQPSLVNHSGTWRMHVGWDDEPVKRKR